MKIDHDNFTEEFIKTNNEIIASCHRTNMIVLNTMIQLNQFIINENIRKMNKHQK